MVLTRRQMLKLGAGAMAACTVPHSLRHALAARPGKKLPIGLELWSVKEQCKEDLAGVLKAVGEMGYPAVELAHEYYGHDAQTWKELLDKNGLVSCGMHMKLAMLEGDALAETVAFHKVLKTPYLVVASVPKKNIESVDAIRQTAKVFNSISDKLVDQGMRLGYHCHGGDFVPVGGSTPWELLADNTKPEVIMQIDIGNCLGGGGDPYAMIEKYPGRSTSVHLKEFGGPAGSVVGEGEVDWKRVFKLCESVGGTKLYVVEEEGRKGPEALAAVSRSLQNLRKMGK